MLNYRQRPALSRCLIAAVLTQLREFRPSPVSMLLLLLHILLAGFLVSTSGRGVVFINEDDLVETEVVQEETSSSDNSDYVATTTILAEEGVNAEEEEEEVDSNINNNNGDSDDGGNAEYDSLINDVFADAKTTEMSGCGGNRSYCQHPADYPYTAIRKALARDKMLVSRLRDLSSTR